MITISEYKKRFIDPTGEAPAILLNLDGESLILRDVLSVTNLNGKLKMKWRALSVPEQWHDYTHIALLKDNKPMYISAIEPVNFDGKRSNLEVTFYE